MRLSGLFDRKSLVRGISTYLIELCRIQECGYIWRNGSRQLILNLARNGFDAMPANGTGLRLAVCYGIAHRHKAKIHVDTNSGGTTFYVNFQCHNRGFPVNLTGKPFS